MNEETSQKHCPKCKALISPDAPGGLCPHCLLQFVAMSTGGADFPVDDRSPPDIDSIRLAFPQLEILDVIGQGGMGAVYKARQPKLDRIVALKILPLRLAREPSFAERFEREGRLLARLNHPNIVGVYDFGQAGEFYYLIMEYVDGVNLRQAFASSRFTPQQALSVIPKICEALQFAHDEGVLHRDIKPENILLDRKGRVKIADFGIAKFSGVDDKTGLTATGATIGTPHYMAPEQVEQPANVDHRADIFSLGVVFYEMLTGELPLGRFSAPSERTKSLDARIDNVVMRSLEKDRERRQQSANEVRTEVELLSNNPLEKTSPTQSNLPIVTAAALSQRYYARPMIMFAFFVVSLVLPFEITFLCGCDARARVVVWSALTSWLSIPGVLLGFRHLGYLRESGNRMGLKRALGAAIFWPSVFVAVCFYNFIEKVILGFNNSKPIETYLTLFALTIAVLIPPFSIWFIKTQIEGTAPIPNFSHPRASGRNSANLGFLFKSLVITVWVFVGIVLLYLVFGTQTNRKTNTQAAQQTTLIFRLPKWA